MTRQFKIGDFLKRIKNQIDINDSVKYKRVTVSGNHKGVSLRDELIGSAIGTKKQFTIKAGDFILSKIDARNGAFGIIPDELDNAIITGNFWTYSVDTNLIDIEWFFYFTHSYNFIQICIESSTGSTHRKYMDEKVFLNHKIILPEIDEQKEMVKKYKTSSKISNSLTSEIQTQKQLLTQLKQSILQEAIQGKLTADWRAQNTGAEPASELLKRIKAEKAQLIKDKKIKKEKALPPITEEEIPFELPEGWVWTILDEVSLFKNGKAHEQFVDANGEYILINSRFVSTNGKTKKYTGEQMMPMYKDEIAIVMSDVPNGRALSRCFMIDDNDKYSLNQRIGGIIALSGMYQEYLIKILDRNSHYLSFNDGKKQTNLKKTQIMTCPIPLPPTEEQKAIVEKVKTLMRKCDGLEQEIKTSEAHAQMLMQAVLKEAFEGKQEVVEV